MQANGARTAAVVLALTMLVSAAAIAGNEPVRHYPPEPPQPSRSELVEIGVISSGFPVPGALPPEIYPADCCGLDEEPDLTWLVVVMTAVGLMGLLAAAFAIVPLLLRWRPSWPRLGWRGLRRRERGRPQAPEPAVDAPSPAEAETDTEVARRALDSALVALDGPADPRGAVIEAYARMEEVLAARELARRDPEAPREYLRRVLREQGMPERPLTALTELFEEARFSRHPIEVSTSDRARRELESARDGLPVRGF